MKEKIVQVNKKMNKIKKLLEDEEEPYKTEALKVIYAKFLNDELSFDILPKSTVRSTVRSIQPKDDLNPITKLSRYCEISENEIRNVLEFENEQFVITKKILGNTTAEKQVNASLLILTAWEIGTNTHWIKVTQLADSLRDLHIDIKHLGENLSARRDYFSIKGTRKGASYHVTTRGIEKGAELLKSLI